MKKFGLLMVAVIIAFAVCGVGYARYNGGKYGHNNTVYNSTSSCQEVKFTSATSNDPGETIDPGYCKHVASTEVRLGSECSRCCDPTSDTITVTISNAYPCYESTVHYTIKSLSRCYNAKLCSINIEGIQLTPEQAGQTVDLGDYEVTVNPPQNILPCSSEDGSISVHIKQSAMQNHTYQFTVTMNYKFACYCNDDNDDDDDDNGNNSNNNNWWRWFWWRWW